MVGSARLEKGLVIPREIVDGQVDRIGGEFHMSKRNHRSSIIDGV